MFRRRALRLWCVESAQRVVSTQTSLKTAEDRLRFPKETWLVASRHIEAVAETASLSGQIGPPSARNSKGQHTAAYGARHGLILTSASPIFPAGTALSFGASWNGRLGQAGVSLNESYLRVAPVSFPYNVVVKAVSAGTAHSLFVSTAGEVWSCGSGAKGRLGHGEDRDATCPRVVQALQGIDVASAAAGGSHSLVVTSGGIVYAWGAGEMGQLGTGGIKDGPLPREVSLGERCVHVAAGSVHSVFVGTLGSLHTCGDGAGGRLGHGREEYTPHPRQVQALEAFEVVSAAAG